MRVAVLISGQHSGNSECLQSIIENIIKPYSSDTFVSYASDSHIYTQTEIELVWNPKCLIYGEFPSELSIYSNSFQNHNKHSETNLDSFVKGAWGVYTANQLKQKYEQENGFKYDFVVRCRPDLLIQQPLVLKNKGINIPIGWDHRGGYNDTFAYGDSDSMDWYADLYTNIKNYADAFLTIHPESYLRHHLDRGDFSIWRWHFPIRLRDMELSQLEYRQK